jgi:hypothetical protein
MTTMIERNKRLRRSRRRKKTNCAKSVRVSPGHELRAVRISVGRRIRPSRFFKQIRNISRKHKQGMVVRVIFLDTKILQPGLSERERKEREKEARM